MEQKSGGFLTGFLVAACIGLALGVGILIAEFRNDRLGNDRVNRINTPAPCPDCKCKQPTAPPGPSLPSRRTGDTGELAK